MTDVLSEATADQQVIKSLLKYIRKLEGHMSRLLFDEKGTMYIAHQFEVITPESIQEKIQENTDEITNINRVLAAASTLRTVETTEVAPEVPAQAEIVAPVVEPTTPVETPAEQPAPVEPEIVPTPIIIQ